MATTHETNGDPSALGFSPDRLERIGRFFEEKYVDTGRIAGFQVTVERDGLRAWHVTGGHQDREGAVPVRTDAIWRIYSMTKPITAVATMMLWEEGAFDLYDPVGKWIEALSAPRVWDGGTQIEPRTVPAVEPVRVWHLLTHTAGLTYGFQYNHPTDAIYRAKGYEFGYPKGADLEQAVRDWAETPLMFQPGTSWNYSVGLDVLGLLIERRSGQSIEEFFRTRIFEPLGMSDTLWWCPPDRDERLAMFYVHTSGGAMRQEQFHGSARHEPRIYATGGGLLSTADDYERFMRCIANGGELNGVRLLAPTTVQMMGLNYLPGGGDLETIARDSFAETAGAGVGYGLGFGVTVDRAAAKVPLHLGSLAWGGAASTGFWIDRVADLTVGFYTQLLPSGTYPFRRELQQLVYQALTE